MLDKYEPRHIWGRIILAAAFVIGAADLAKADANGFALRGVDCNTNGVPDELDVSGPIVYVDADATGAGTGDNWTDALTDLQMALCMAGQPALGITEIRVAEGTYRPADSNGLRTATFQLLDGVALYGGYAGSGQPDPNHRNFKVHETILSGDLAGNDVGTNGRGENSYHVVTASGTAATALLDGFTVARGNADGIGSDANGGGIYAASGAATIRNCHITSNGAANEGGGVYGSTGKISKCRVSANRAYKGAGLYNCAHISHSYIVRNGVWLDSAGDTYTGGGLGACNQVYNNVISGNAAQYGGGAHQCQAIINCTIAGNEAQTGSGVEVLFGSKVWNSIIWHDTLTGAIGPNTNISYNVLPFPFGLTFGNIITDPLFLDAAGADGIYGTADDNLRLSPSSPSIDAGTSVGVPVDVADVDEDGNIIERIPLDLDGSPRIVDDPTSPDTGVPFPNGLPVPGIVDIGAFEYRDCNSNGMTDLHDISSGTSLDCNANNIPDECDVLDPLQDCNANAIPDHCDIAGGTSSDCDLNSVPDECDLASGPSADCNTNGLFDACEVLFGTASDCDGNGIPDECDLESGAGSDCNTNGLLDACEVLYGTASDCDANGVPDECDLQTGMDVDCNTNGLFDACEILLGTASDCNLNGIPDECDLMDVAADCNSNGMLDACEVAAGTAGDCNLNGVPDECDVVASPGIDCNSNGTPDVCDIDAGTSMDCNQNSVPDECDLLNDSSDDCNGNSVPDECEYDCDGNGIPDDCDLMVGTSLDCNSNGVPDVCDILAGSASDCNVNGIPDSCDVTGGTSADCDDNGVSDVCDIIAGSAVDCNANWIPDDCEIAAGTSTDCDDNGVPDACDLDCDENGLVDACEVAFGTAEDCNSNGVPDICDIQGGLPEEQANLIAQDAAAFDQAGFSVSVDGVTALVGAPFDDDGGNSTGSAYVYRRVSGTWQQIAKLNAPNPRSQDNFGRSVALSGSTALIGAHLDDDLGLDSGAAYVFREVAGEWVMVSKLKAADAGSTDLFGYSVALSGNTAVIGAIQDDVGVTNSGSAYVFREIGGAWQQVQKLTASDGGNNDWFGSSVAIRGSTMIVGAYSDDNVGTDSGSAYIFREFAGNWQQQAKLTASDAAAQDLFGFSVSITGGAAIVGSYADDDNGSASGSAYIFRDIDGTWQQVAKLRASDAAAGDRFGYSVALVNNTAWIGANGNDDDGSDSGSAYMFENSNGVWTEVAKLTASDAAAGDRFGSSISASQSGKTLLVGAHLNDGPATDNGSAYVFVSGVSALTDCNENGRLDSCEVAESDCNSNGIPDDCDIDLGSIDCNLNGIPDECELVANDCNSNGIPDECDPDLDGDGIPDDCDPCAAGQASGDADGDGNIGLDDYTSLEGCLLGAAPSAGPGCECFDFDGNGTVDLLDFAEFQVEFTIAGGG